MTIDVDRARAETPGCAHVTHLNNAGASLAPAPVLDTVLDYLRREADVGGYELALASSDAIEAVYASIARFVGAAPDEIALLDSATRAWDTAFGAIRFEPGDRILVSGAEYVSNILAILGLARRVDVRVERIPDDEHGQVDVHGLRAMLDDDVRLVAVTHVPTNGGLVNPAAAVGAVVAESDALYLLDACQSVGQLVVDVHEIGCHLLAATGRKFIRAPRGTGFLFVDRGVVERLEPTFVDLRSATWVAPDRYELQPDARRFETYERNVATVLGLGAAVDYALAWGPETIEARVVELARRLRERLSGTAGVVVRDVGRRRCGIVTFTVDGHDPRALAEALRGQRINVWVSDRDSARIDFQSRNTESVVRASVHYYNTEDEIERLVDAIRRERTGGAHPAR